MRKSILFLTVILCSCHSTPSKHSTVGLAAYVKAWGYLKYFHPNVVNGHVDWDSAFIADYPLAAECTSPEEISEAVSHLFRSAHGVASFGFDTTLDQAQLIRLSDTSWMSNGRWYSKEIQKSLRGCYSNNVRHDGAYVQPTEGAGNPNFGTDIGDTLSPYPDEATRMLSLAQYWNSIEYYAPDKDIIGEPWDSVLTRFIPKVAKAHDVREYQNAMLACCCSINDGHSYTTSPLLDSVFGKYFLPFGFSMIEGKFVITHAYPKLRPQYGDEILSINGQPIQVLCDDFKGLVPGSNEASRGRNLRAFVSRLTSHDSVEIEYSSARALLRIKIHPLSKEEYALNPLHSDTGVHWKTLPGNIGYVNMGLLVKEEVGAAMKDLAHTKAIVFDIRNYPNGTLWDLEHYFPGNADWVRFRRPNFSCPGTFQLTEHFPWAPRTGEYHGEVLILVNEKTQSHAEYTAMMFQSIPGCVVVGSQTAGADGNVSTITLPGGIKTMFSGLGVFYPDGSPTQRVGIKVDVEVHPTIAGIRAGRDEVLEKAMEICRKG